MARVRVEDCLCLDMVLLTRRDALRPGFGDTYRFFQGDKEIESISWELTDDCLRFHCTRIASDGNWVPYSYWVLVSYTATQFGGRRAWFHCPACDKRVRKLFRPPGGDIDFKCRDCHDLTYTSQQRHRSHGDKRMDRLWADMKFDSVRGVPSPAAVEKEAELLRALLEVTRRPLPNLASIPESRELFDYPPQGRPKVKRPYHRTRPFAQGERKSPSERLCMRCRDYRELEDPRPITLPNGRLALRGHCPVCGAKMTAITKGS